MHNYQDQDELEHKERALRKRELQRQREEEDEFNVHDILRMDPRSLISGYDR